MRKPANGYRFPEGTYRELDRQGLILYGEDEKRIIKIKKYLKDFEDTLRSVIVMDGRLGSYDFKRVFNIDEKIFDNPKPVDLILQLASYVSDKDSLILDMFAGSATTAEAIIRLNKADKGTRQVICVQLPEKIEEDSAAFRYGFRTIADIGRERIRRVITQLHSEGNGDATAVGYKSFLLTPSNFKQWRGDGIETPEQLAEQVGLFVKSEKEGAEVEDILFELLLKFGQELTGKVETLELAEVRVFAIHERKMLFVLDGFTEEMIEPLLALKPREIIALDSAFHDSDELKSNLDLHCRDAGIKFTCI
jgi:adenine-specific DNA-methyltransferase